MSKKNIALLAGGYSGEYVISVNSASVAEQHIDADRFNVYKIIIDAQKWTYTAANGQVHHINRSDFSLSIDDQRIQFDAVLMLIHGTPGEDGKLQGYFDLLNIPYTSCDATTSAITFNKRYTVATAAFSGINVATSVHLFRGQAFDMADILRQVTLPVFVKPNNGGSSIGMSRVDKAEDVAAAIEKAFKEDDQVLVESFIEGREFTVGVFGTKEGLVVLPICEVRTEKTFFDFEAKYKGLSEEIIPAPIDAAQTEVLRQTAARVYKIFNCKGIVRIDFIWSNHHNAPFMLEINTVPGQSAESIVPQMVRAYGWTMQDFYTKQLENIL